MEDNQRVRQLVQDLLDAVNASRLPLAVKALAVENVLLHITAVLREKTPAAAGENGPQEPPAE